MGHSNLEFTLGAPPGHLPATWILPSLSTGMYRHSCLFNLAYAVLFIAGLFLFIVGVVVVMLIFAFIDSAGEKRAIEEKMNIEKKMVVFFARAKACGL